MTTFVDTFFGDLTFDAVITENYLETSTLTANPVEFGAEINDHIFDNPPVYTLVGGVSNIVFDLFGFSFFSSTAGTVGAPDFPGLDRGTRKATAWETLRRLKTLGLPFTVTTNLTTLNNMVVTSLETFEDKSTYGSLQFIATLQRVFITFTDVQTLDSSLLESGATTEQAGGVNERGTVSKEEPPRSLLRSISDAVGITNE